MLLSTLVAALFALPQSPAAKPASPGSGSASAASAVRGSTARHFALRLRPGQDLQQEIFAFAKREDLRAAAIVTCVGSLKIATVRFANQPAGTPLTGPFEIVSLVGAFTRDGGHLHIALSDGKGATIGGHLMPGSAVYTTAEIVLVELQDLAFSREKDNETTYDELVVRPRK
jgi:predicted DNA-binding protein with PD1-like motif